MVSGRKTTVEKMIVEGLTVVERHVAGTDTKE
jgi:hypothetical protein